MPACMPTCTTHARRCAYVRACVRACGVCLHTRNAFAHARHAHRRACMHAGIRRAASKAKGVHLCCKRVDRCSILRFLPLSISHMLTCACPPSLARLSFKLVRAALSGEQGTFSPSLPTDAGALWRQLQGQVPLTCRTCKRKELDLIIGDSWSEFMSRTHTHRTSAPCCAESGS